ncbi:MAG TPA: carbohydrate porin [Chthoniobacterales bacterium]|jgi:maltoporin|nr:carbohydrate porin [Chthoniobacterales bacterium]
MDSPVRPPRMRGLQVTLVAGLALLTTDALFAQSAGQSDVDSLKTQMNQMQRQYEQRIEAMEAKMKALESNANSGSILNTRVLGDANGTEAPGKAPAPMLDESFLKSLTRNFTFNMYVRAGFMFNGSGGAGTFNFEIPDNPGGRYRLGNENDFYMEASFNQAHILGDSPDVADVSFRMTPNFFTNGVFHESFLTTNNTGSNSKGVNDFNVGMREAFVEMKNVIKSAPEVTFWAGQRFYDRYNTDPADWFWLDTSGFGIGAYNIHLGPGNLYVAWIGANHDSLDLVNDPDQANFVGDQFEQTIDIRYKDIDIGFGKLSFVGIGNYIKGANNITGTPGNTTFTNVFGGTDTINVATSDAYGAGGGVIWQYDFGNKSYLRVFGLFGWGVTNFSAENLGNAVGNFESNVNNFLVHGPAAATNVHQTGVNTFSGSVNPYQNSSLFRAGFEFVYNVNNCFAFNLWGDWDHQVQGFQTLGTNGSGAITTANATRNWYGVALRPVWWIADNIAIQGQAGFQYVDNVRGYSGTNAFGNSGEFGIFTIAPTIKPKGGYFTRPELRLFATYSIWSNSLKGTTTPTGEGGNLSGSNPPYNGNTNQGWLLGSQLEIWF